MESDKTLAQSRANKGIGKKARTWALSIWRRLSPRNVEATETTESLISSGEELAEVAPLEAPPLGDSGQAPEIDPTLIDPDAVKVVLRLQQFGHQAYLVGGCVRDLLLGRTPKDFDVATSAHPGEVRAVFRNCRLIGRRFRLAHIYFKGGKLIEVSTFRANPSEMEEPVASEDAEAELSPDPDPSDDLFITHDNVFGTAQQDARRRDFTINGLFYDLAQGKVIDHVKGTRDLKLRQIRTIGDPEVRMREDPVRILRAVRFACKLGLDIEPRTYAAMEGAVEDLPRCSAPRLLEETFRLVRGGDSAESLKLLDALDALKVLLPPVAEHLHGGSRAQADEFFAFASALDQRVRRGDAAVNDAVVLAALLWPVSQKPAREGEVAAGIESLLEDLVQTARLPRRIAERCRSILVAQKVLTGERRRRGPLSAFREHPVFADALAVFEIVVEVTGRYQAELAAWHAGQPLSAKPGAEGPSRRKRRRRGPRPAAPASSP